MINCNYWIGIKDYNVVYVNSDEVFRYYITLTLASLRQLHDSILPEYTIIVGYKLVKVFFTGFQKIETSYEVIFLRIKTTGF